MQEICLLFTISSGRFEHSNILPIIQDIDILAYKYHSTLTIRNRILENTKGLIDNIRILIFNTFE